MPPSRIPIDVPPAAVEPPPTRVMVGERLHPIDAPVLRADDRGFLYGDGIFETIRAIDGAPRHLDRHLARLNRGLATLAIPPVDGAILARRIDTLLTANGLRTGESAIRLTVSRGPGGGPRPGPATPTVVIAARRPGPALAERRAGVRLRTVTGPHRLVAGLKSLCYLPSVLASLAVEPGEEPLFVDPGGAVLEGATCNVFARFGDRLCTPPADGALLPGVARGLVIERAAALGLAVEARRLTLDDLRRADGVLVTNALLPVAPVRALDGQPRAAADVAPLARLIAADGAPEGTR